MLDVFRTLHTVLGDIEGGETVREAVVFAAWRRIAGESLAEHAVPIKLEKERLFVAVSNLMWQRQLKDLCGQMVFKLNAALGGPTVNFIELQINEQAVSDDRAKRSHPQVLDEADVEKEISPELARAADGIDDDELRRQFLLAAGSCLVRKQRLTKSEPEAITTGVDRA